MRQNRLNFKAKMIKALYCVLVMCVVVVIMAPIEDLSAQNRRPSIIRDTEIEATFQEWSTPLLKSSEIGENSVKIILVQSDQVNAFVAGGANIFFYTGLIKKTDSPGEVLGVLAHEMGHIAGGHLIRSQEAMERASYESILGTVLGIGAAIVTGNGAAANAIIAGTQGLATSRFLSHSRINESSADQAAFSYLTKAGINPSGLASFFEKLQDQELLPSTQQSEYIRTHPITRNRIEATRALITKNALKDKPYPQSWYQQHARMKAKLLGFINPEQVGVAYPDSQKDIASRYANTIAAYRLNDIPSALRGIDELIFLEPENPYFHELKGQMLVDFSRVREAIPSYKKSVEIMPEASLIRIALAHALLEVGNDEENIKDAISHLNRAQITERRSTRVFRLLATAHGRLGEGSMSKLYLAEEAVLQNRLPYAKVQAQAALNSFEVGSREWIRSKDVLTHITNLQNRAQR